MRMLTYRTMTYRPAAALSASVFASVFMRVGSSVGKFAGGLEEGVCGKAMVM